MAEFLALRCYACKMFQVKPRKKSSSKWCCSVCNEKQSVTKVYGSSGAAKKIRELVQTLNYSPLAQEQDHFEPNDVGDLTTQENGQSEVGEKNVHGYETKPSKWAEYLETEDSQVESRAGDEDTMYVTSIPESATKRKRTERLHDEVACYECDGLDGPLKAHSVSSEKNTKKTTIATGSKLHGAGYLGKENVPVKNDLNSGRWSNCGTKSETGTCLDEWRKQNAGGLQSSSTTRTDSSKWRKYLETDETKRQFVEPDTDRAQSCSRKWFHPQHPSVPEDALHTELADELVTEDIHPSFL
ncbi:uncharacterized protein LOC9649247 [Selaginella moellendorffii]|uniref:uncharacterized protein LOC9649247 n=1 Tax=Selaginella moellendorffii TaxID=88036 RepID=UPI000D1CCA06|nr:uncharacterized protein LOC9649247 [Selaginella moellendorffii]|eukprot:XP_002986378.2 uncharacterized protein LOC9649247 [Selaginella moellendorffii]